MAEKEIFQIIDAYHLVINGGSSHGLSEGEEVEVFVKGEQLTDPFNNNEPLGTLDYVKEVLTIENVYPKFSICINEVREKVEVHSAISAFTSNFATKNEWRYKNLRLNIKDEEITGGYPEVDKDLLLGDKVRIRHV